VDALREVDPEMSEHGSKNFNVISRLSDKANTIVLALGYVFLITGQKDN